MFFFYQYSSSHTLTWQYLDPPKFREPIAVKFLLQTKSNHSAGPLCRTRAETLSVQLVEFIYLWQTHVLSHPLILYSCQKPVKYAFPPQTYWGRERQDCETGQGVYVFMVCVWWENIQPICSIPHIQTQCTWVSPGFSVSHEKRSRGKTKQS